MKVTFELNLPEDKEDYKTFSNAQEYRLALWELEQYLRSKTKYPPDSVSDEELKGYKTVREEFYRILQARNLDID
jgi:hypothetical protein